MAVLPHDSPGYTGWDISEQARLLPVVLGDMQPPGPLRVLDSARSCRRSRCSPVYGLTRQVNAEGRLTSLVPCQQCTLARCQYRRRPYMWSKASAVLDASGTASALAVTGDSPLLDAPASAAETPDDTTWGKASALAARRSRAQPLRSNAAYRTSRKALQRWARERLIMVPREDGGVDAQFRYDGTTCTNMGRELAFRYDVTLGPRSEGFPIRAQRCDARTGRRGAHRHVRLHPERVRADGRHRRRASARRVAPGRRAIVGPRFVCRGLLLRCLEPRAQVGARARDDPLRAQSGDRGRGWEDERRPYALRSSVVRRTGSWREARGLRPKA